MLEIIGYAFCWLVNGIARKIGIISFFSYLRIISWFLRLFMHKLYTAMAEVKKNTMFSLNLLLEFVFLILLGRAIWQRP